MLFKKYRLINTNKSMLLTNKEIIKLLLTSIKFEVNKNVITEITIDKNVYFIAISGCLDEL